MRSPLRIKSRTLPLGIGAILALVLIGTALADNTDLDSDGLAAFTSNSTLALGDRCIGTTYASNVLVAVRRNGAYTPGTQVFKNATTATVSVTTDSSSELSEAVPDTSIQIPSDWSTQANNTLTSTLLGVPDGTGTVAVNLLPASLGAKSETVTIRAAGTNPSNAAIQRDTTLTVTWTGIDCTPANTTPSIAYVSPPSAANEGETRTFNFTITDPDAGDSFTFADGYPSCGANGSPVGGSASIVAKAGTFQCSFPDGDTTTSVTVKVKDAADALSNEISQAVDIANVAPTIALSGDATVNEGAVYTLTLGNVVDPGTDTVTGFVINWGDGNSDAFVGSPDGLNKTHTYADNAASVTITVDLTDEDGTFLGAGSKTIAVNNVAPSLGALTATPNIVAINTNVVVSGSFTDPGSLDTHTCVVDPDTDSGEGVFVIAAAVLGDPGDGSCSATVKYATAGVYRVSMQVKDDDGGASNLSYYEYVVVYDPSAGFVTGGGSITAQAGSYVPDPSLSGKGTFGFVSKYLKGATTPTGNTEFQFHAAKMNFNSSNYQWLVVSGAKAQFKGTGTLNGAGGYGFLLTATDGSLNGGGGVDKFRIKIWALDGGTVVFDNNMGASDDIDAGSVQSIDGGSIVIHTPKK